MKKTIIISAVNLSEGGPLTIIKSALDYLDTSIYSESFKIVALVHSKLLFEGLNNVEIIEFPEIKSSWFKRVKFEYFECVDISKKLNSFLWLSLHDITPNVVSEKRAVYCHNPSPFYNQRSKDFFKKPLRYLYTKYYKILYQINIHKNDYVIVQQKWIKDEFVKLFNLNKKKVIVSLPNQERLEANATNHRDDLNNNFTFIYPAFPREFKNFEVICKAVSVLKNLTSKEFSIILTIDGSENEYSKNIIETFKEFEEIKFVGLQPKPIIENYYKEANCLIFPSKLETWGLPISEFKMYNKPMLIADLPYSYETVGDYEKVKYFDPINENQLAKDMDDLMNKKLIYNNKGKIEYDDPICRSWDELFKLLLK